MSRGANWTDADVKFLREMYPNTLQYTFEEIMQHFPTRTPNAVRLKASRLGLEREYLPEYCPHCGESLRTETDG